MPLKRPVTLPQARRWPAAAKRRQSFCARMGGMRARLTGERAARDPASPINRALAAWDCDEPELLLRAEHVSKGIRMKITKGKVGSESRKTPARKNPARKTAAPAKKTAPSKTTTYAVVQIGRRVPVAVFANKADAVAFGQSWADIHKAPVQVIAG